MTDSERHSGGGPDPTPVVAPDRSTLRGLAAVVTAVFVMSMMFSVALVQTAAIALMLLWLATEWRGRHGTNGRRVPFMIPVLVFAAARVLSILFSVSHAASIPAVWIELVYVPVYFSLVRFLDDGTVRPERVMQLFIAAAVVAAAAGILRYAAGAVPRAASTTSGYYTLGLYLTASLPVILLVGRTLRLPGTPWSWMVGAGVIVAGIVLTMNRLHWVTAAAIGGGIVLWKERRLALPLLALVVLAVLFVPPVADRVHELLQIFSHQSGRDVLWRGAAILAGEHPITGFGPRTFPLIFPLFPELPDKGIGGWHNDYLQTYMESGAIGLAALLWLFISVIRSGLRTVKRTSPASHERSVLVAILLALAVFVVAGGIYDTIGGLLFRMLLALLAVTIPAVPSPASVPPPVQGPRNGP